ncbi:MAG: HEAT repeat domain-containing protein [Spirochaetales bacterium]|nr:HEAT repeat domain-containing protein [Spirochaetales bacterium]
MGIIYAMESMFFLMFIVMAVVGGIAVTYSLTRNAKYSEELSKVAKKYKIKLVSDSRFFFPSVEGEIDGYRISIYKKNFSYGKSSIATLAFEVSLSERRLRPFSISAEGFLSKFGQLLGDKDLQTGDKYFDKTFLIRESDADEIYTMLNYRARNIIESCMNLAYAGNFTITHDNLLFCVRLDELASAERISDQIDKVMELVKILCRKGTRLELITENYYMETNTQMKINLLKSLSTSKDALSEDIPLIQEALKAQNQEIQFHAARLLGKKGLDRLKSLYKRGANDIKAMIIQHLAHLREAGFLDFFLQQADRETDFEVKREIILYFKNTGDAKAEPFLRNELERTLGKEYIPDSAGYKSALIDALKRCGTYDSIEPLYKIRSMIFKREADKAIAAIQHRIGAGDKGWLSIDKGKKEADGSLSLADTDGSLPPTDNDEGDT